MNRRALLAAGGLGLSSCLVGCLGGAGSSPGVASEPPSCDLRINEASNDTDRLVTAWPRNDVPPYEVTYPEDAEEAEDWNPTYLGERMPTTPSLDFQTRPVAVDRGRQLADLPTSNSSYVVELIESEDEREDIPATGDTNLDESVLVLVGDCCGSSSVEHRWARVEETADGVHLHGYLTVPWIRTSDLSPRYSLLAIERPSEEVDVACISLTVGEDERVHFNSTDGVVSLVSAVMANDRAEPVDVYLQITTTADETRVDREFTIDADTQWRGIGMIGEPDETFVVELVVDALDVDVREEYPAAAGTLGIRLTREGDAVVGRSNEI